MKGPTPPGPPLTGEERPITEQPMKSTITAKFQTTIPKKVREHLKLKVHDVIDWQVEEGKVVVSPVRRDFLAYRNRVLVGTGDIHADIERTRTRRGEEGGGGDL